MKTRGYVTVEQEHTTGQVVVTNVAVEDFDLVASGSSVLIYKHFGEEYDIELSVELDGYRIAHNECCVHGKDLEQADYRTVRVIGGRLWLE
ncbi:MAG: hypothetical protein EOO81_10965 [Oxalobacteraceae bacterium]|nr:MAG: hypothetical protein EOO81_10965 [Oxalobacteraceae bacterium]